MGSVGTCSMAMRIRKVTAPRGGGFKSGSPKPAYDPLASPPTSMLKYRGPTHYSNWFILGMAQAGAYPGSMDDRIHRNQLSLILKSGVTTFICTQAEYDPNATEAEWRRCQKLRPYFQDAIDIIRSSKQSRSRANMFKQNPEDLQFVYFPIIDQDVAPDKDFIMLIHDLLARLDRGEKFYLHCWGGHGRTGTVAAVLLGLLYDITPREALNRVQKYHDVRLEAAQYRMKIDSPQRPSQRAQVRRVLLGWNSPVNVHGFRGYNRSKENNQQIANETTQQKNQKKDTEHNTPDRKESPSNPQVIPKRFDFSTPVLSANGTPTTSPKSKIRPTNNSFHDRGLPSTTKNQSHPERTRTTQSRHNTPPPSKILPSSAKLKVGPLKPASGGVVNIGLAQNSSPKAPKSPGSMSLPPDYITPFSPTNKGEEGKNKGNNYSQVRHSFSSMNKTRSPSRSPTTTPPKKQGVSPLNSIGKGSPKGSSGNKFHRLGAGRGTRL